MTLKIFGHLSFASDLSPMKDSQGGQYFHGELTDDEVSMRVNGSDYGVRKKLVEHKKVRK